MKELEGEIESTSQPPNNQQVAMGTARASKLSLLIVNVDSSRSRIGRGLESIGGMTADTLQRISTAVGEVVRSPVVLMAKVGGFASPQATTLIAPPESSLEERVYHLENQMKSLEEKFNPMAIVTEIDLSTCSHKVKPQIGKTPLQEMEIDKMLEKHVQMLEHRVNERMERFEKTLLSIQSQLDHVEFSWRENVVGNESQESLSCEPPYYDVEQQSDNFEVLEAGEQIFFGGSPTLEKSPMKETSSIAPTIVECKELPQEVDSRKNDAFLEPRVASSMMYSEEALLMQPMKFATPSNERIEFAHKDDAINVPTTSEWQLASTLEVLHASFITNSLAIAASAEFSETTHTVSTKKSIFAQGEHEHLEHQLSEEHDQHLERGLEQWPTQEHGQEIGQDHGPETIDALGQEHEQELAENQRQQCVEEPAQEPTQEVGLQLKQQAMTYLNQEDFNRNSVMALPPSEPQITFVSGEFRELLSKEPLAIAISTKFEELPQAIAIDESSNCDLPLQSIVGELQNDAIVSLKKSLSSASFHQSSNHDLLENLDRTPLDITGNSSTLEEAPERDLLSIAPILEIAQGLDGEKSDNVHLLFESQLEESKKTLANDQVKAIPSSESRELIQEVDGRQSGELTQEVGDRQSDAVFATFESQNGNANSLAKGKHGQDEVDHKFLEDVKVLVGPSEDSISRTQSDLTYGKLNSKANEDTIELQSQGSFPGDGDTLEDSKEAMVKDPLPSAMLLQLFEEENNFGKVGSPVQSSSPMTSLVEDKPPKPLIVELELPLASTMLEPKNHHTSRRRSFARSSSEPQFAYKLEEHCKALAKESSVPIVVVPSASKLGGGKHDEEEISDSQCLPFKFFGEGKHPRKELEFKLVKDVKSPTMKSETSPSPYVLEPKPSNFKGKKKKEKKERKPDPTTEEKERRLSLEVGEMERKSSWRAEEKDSKYSSRVEEKHKQSFMHLRDRLRHAFSVNKEP